MKKMVFEHECVVMLVLSLNLNGKIRCCLELCVRKDSKKVSKIKTQKKMSKKASINELSKLWK
jgi:hypothetical protein